MTTPTDPLVKISDGLLRGKTAKSALGDLYYSFQGIPYAEPPVGPLRFKPPQQIAPWAGEKSAQTEPPIAPSLDYYGVLDYLESSNEDCLYLNVYTNELPPKNKLRPVLFWIHGGGFIEGSGNPDFYGPDYFMKQDVILVTINYRLGALGFLSLQNENCPGNNGLRDMLEALRWVQRNIDAFGGNKNNVTIFGQSAGGAAVQYLMLSQQSRGLFHRAITQSGSCLNGWAFSRKPVEYAFALGEALGFKTDNKDDLLEFLKNVPARDIAVKSAGLLPKIEPHLKNYVIGEFVPCVEPPSPHAVLCADPEDLLRAGEVMDVPYMLGVLTLEGPIMFKIGETTKELTTTDQLERMLPPHVNLVPGSPFAASILNRIKEFYFKDGFDENKFVDVMSWVYFLAGNEIALRGLKNNLGRTSKTYSYEFTYDGNQSILKPMWDLQDWKGTFHCDELMYLFYSNKFPTKLEQHSSNAKVTDLMIKLWTDFAHHGNPTPWKNEWKPYEKEESHYVDINESITVREDIKRDETEFWLSIFDSIYEEGCLLKTA